MITGNAYTQWATGASTVNFGPNITVVSTQVDDSSHIEAVISVAAGAPVGYRTVVVQTGHAGSHQQLPGDRACASADSVYLV